MLLATRDFYSRFELVFFLVILLVLVFAVHRRNVVWADEVSSWRNARLASPGKVRPINNYANALRDDAGDPRSAIKEYREAIRVAPLQVPPRSNLAVAYLMLGMYDEAVIELEVAVSMMPDHHVLHGNLGYAYLKKRRWKMAKTEFETALKLKPGYRLAIENLKWLELGGLV